MSNTQLATMPSVGSSIGSYLGGESVKAGIAKVVNEKNVDRFITSIVSAVQANPQLMKCTNQSILSAALMGESLQLAPSPQLGYYYFVGYKNKKQINGKWTEVEEAQFQMGWRGMVQLAIRSGQYKNIVVNEIKEGEIDYNPITEEINLHPIKNPTEREEAKTIGYYAAFELVSGFKKQMFSPIEALEAHARKYSKSYRYDLSSGKKASVWSTNFDAMAKKTMIRQLLGKWGIMSVEMQQAYVNDMGVIDKNGVAHYVDNTPDNIEVQVHEEIEQNANSVAFEDVIEESAPAVEEAMSATEPEQKQEQPKKPGRPKKSEPKPEPVSEPEVVPFEDAPEWA